MTSNIHPPRKKEVGTLNEALPPIRLGARSGDFMLGTLSLESSPWYESPEEVEEALQASAKIREEAKALVEVMREYLTPAEFKAMQLHYLYNMPYRQIGLIMDRNASTAYRYVQRSIKKLRARLDVSEK